MKPTDTTDLPDAAVQAAEHAAVWAAIPWCVAGSASADEQALARKHLEQCADCRAEWAHNERLQRALLRDGPDAEDAAAVDAGLRRLWARIDADAMLEPQPQPRSPAQTWLRVLAVAAVLQALGLATLALVWWQGSGEASYQTLSREGELRPLAVQQRGVGAERTLAELRADAEREGLVLLRAEPRRDGPGWTVHLAEKAAQR